MKVTITRERFSWGVLRQVIWGSHGRMVIHPGHFKLFEAAHIKLGRWINPPSLVPFDFCDEQNNRWFVTARIVETPRRHGEPSRSVHYTVRAARSSTMKAVITWNNLVYSPDTQEVGGR